MLFTNIENTIKSLDINGISYERKEVLQPLINHIQNMVFRGDVMNLNFICTHNSRRSHLAQVWAQALALHHQIKNVVTYSGGTAETALFPSSAKALEAAGFEITTLAEGQNPIYAIKFSDTVHPVIGFSKKYDHAFNPQKNFAAVMTCAQADTDCPFIPGASVRIAVPYEDPKAFDNTPLQAEKYWERSIQIATELHYVFSQIKQ